MKKIKIVKVQKWLPRYLSEFMKSLIADFENKSYSDTGTMAKAVCSYIEGYRVKMMLEKAHRYNALSDYSSRIRYIVGEDCIRIMNITGRCNMLRITLVER